MVRTGRLYSLFTSINNVDELGTCLSALTRAPHMNTLVHPSAANKDNLSVRSLSDPASVARQITNNNLKVIDSLRGFALTAHSGLKLHSSG